MYRAQRLVTVDVKNTAALPLDNKLEDPSRSGPRGGPIVSQNAFFLTSPYIPNSNSPRLAGFLRPKVLE